MTGRHQLLGEFDVVVVGGGSAGAVAARRLAELGAGAVALVEAGPSDEGRDEVLRLRRWTELLESEYDYDYRIEPQARGNGRIRHARAKVLGGCSSHNSCIAFFPPDQDLREWERLGAAGWGPAAVAPAVAAVRARVPVAEPPEDNPLNHAVLDACAALGLPTVRFNQDGRLRAGAGRFQLNARDGVRQSSSVSYLHPLVAVPPELTVLTDTRATRVLVERGRATGVATDRGILRARREVVLSAGAFDTPKLLMLSGIGPADQLRALGVDVLVDLPVGEHLLDHPEGVLNWESQRPLDFPSAQLWEVGVFAHVLDPYHPDLMLHLGLEVFDLQTGPAGFPTAEHGFSLTPNVARARSEGVVRLRSADPAAPPVIDFRYFTDPEGYDERIMLAGVHLAREIAAQAPLRDWVGKELSPGAAMVDDAELSEYVRRTANTVYHPAGTCRMGAPDAATTVVDPELRVLGVDGLRVADASVFPSMPSVNPNLTCMVVGERLAGFVTGRHDPAHDTTSVAPRRR
ncbi:GMC family oxidoreductase [Streptoalloteichus hindustanus]|uniref:Choline oxidase n=1 Tax=Streptoalloteichus hindustanus TaxID=2017 RepID=A0A1M5HBM5_STRHI|nr:GMC oxidoreductase [Streptoalloteichus hindustanus]SHG13365.1 choline oxidase [Streptoalloteichus hindustanus]